MQIWFIFSLIFAVFVALFAVMNSDIVTIQVLWKSYPLSQSVVILISAAFGALVTFTMSLFGKFKSSMKSREIKGSVSVLEKQVRTLEEENKNYQIEIERLKAQAHVLEASKETQIGETGNK